MIKIILGTAQFGLNYGITNTKGQVASTEVEKIFDFANINNIHMVDTASAYGASEKLLGNFQKLEIITKIELKIKHGAYIDGNCLQKIKESLHRLKRENIYGLLLHDPAILLTKFGKSIFYDLVQAKNVGFVKKIGVSVYCPDQLSEIINRFDIDLVQLPMNVLDQRFINSGVLKKLEQKGIEIHIRSIFLQGALLALKTPTALLKWDKNFKKINKSCINLGISQLEFCISFIKNNLLNGSIVIGVNSKAELSEIIDAIKVKTIEQNWKSYASNDINLISPNKWQ